MQVYLTTVHYACVNVQLSASCIYVCTCLVHRYEVFDPEVNFEDLY